MSANLYVSRIIDHLVKFKKKGFDFIVRPNQAGDVSAAVRRELEQSRLQTDYVLVTQHPTHRSRSMPPRRITDFDVTYGNALAPAVSVAP